MLNNIQFLFPEIFLTVSIISILIINVIYAKLNYYNSQIIKSLLLTSIVLSIICYMYINQLFYNNINIIAVNGLITINNLKIWTKLFICIVSLLLTLFSIRAFNKKIIKEIDYVVVLLLSILGLLILINSNNLLILYLGIELYSISFYVLAAINRWSDKSTEAGLKYFVLGSLASGLYLFGTSLIYMVTGELNYLAIQIITNSSQNNNILLLGAIFIVVALLFKIAAAPFHMWAPDVYEGAPLIITTVFATLTKIPLLMVLFNLIFDCFSYVSEDLKYLILISSIFSLIIGCIGGLNQSKFKRLIAYSSISHIGFILLAFSNLTLESFQISLFYTILYIISNLSVFGCFLLILNKTDFITELSGFVKINKSLTITISLLLFSLAGVPPLAGFVTKFLVIVEAIKTFNYFSAFIAILTSTIALIYYIRIIKWMYFKDNKLYNIKNLTSIIKPETVEDLYISIIVGFTFFIVFTLIIYPNIWIKIINYITIFTVV